ncbi:beta-lactamase family protein [Apiospora arundinis]
MEGRKRQENDLKWESFRPEIERKFVAGKQTLDQIVTWLGEQGFPVSKNQLNYRLNTVWRLRRRAPKGKAPEFWRSVGQLPGLISPPENGSGASSLALIHNKRRQRIRPSNFARQTKRYSSDTHSSHPCLSTLAAARLLAGRKTVTDTGESPITLAPRLTMAGIQLTNLNFLRYLAIGGCLQGQRLSDTCLVTRLASEIPELQVGDAARRAKIILSGNSERSAGERLKILLLQISNNHIRWGNWPDEDSLIKFDYLLQLVENSGLTATPLALREHDITIRAVCYTLYQETFSFLWHVSRNKYKLRYDTDRARSLLGWLLGSGQDPNTPITISGYHKRPTTGLQISLVLSIGDLATRLLDLGAVPPGVRHDGGVPDQLYLPPLFLAAMYLKDTDQSVISRVEQFGLSQHQLKISPYYLRVGGPYLRDDWNPINYVLYCCTDAKATLLVEFLFDYPGGRGKYRDMVDWKCAFVHASGSSKLGVLKFLLSRHSDICPPIGGTVHDYVNWADPNGLTAAHVAAAAPEWEDPVHICQFLLQNGAVLEGEDPHHPSMFHMACAYGCLDTVRLLHMRGAHINRRCGYFEIEGGIPKLVSTTLQTPLESALPRFHRYHYSDPYALAICKYLIDNGSEISCICALVDAALEMFDVELLSRTLKLAPPVNCHELPNRIFVSGHRGIREALAKENRLKEVKIEMAHLLLDAGAQVQLGSAAEAAFPGDWHLTTKALAAITDEKSETDDLPDPGKKSDRLMVPPSFRPRPRPTGSFLEAAILSCSTDIARKAFALHPNLYDASALCAATLIATTKSGDFGLVQQNHKEMSAVGIAAYSGNWELLQLLLRHIPLSQQAIVPYLPGEPFDPLELPTSNWDGFWNFGPISSVQIFASQACPRIFNLFVNQIFPMTAELLINLIESSENAHDRVWTLVRKGYHIQQDIDYATEPNPLHHAIETGDISLVRAFLDLGVNIDGCGEYAGYLVAMQASPLVFAIDGGQLEIAGLLIDRGANVNRSEKDGYWGLSPLCVACRSGHLGIVRRLLDAGADPNALSMVSGRYQSETRTALEAAAKDGRLDITHLLLCSGVNTEGTGRLPYIKAARLASDNCHIKVQELLRSHRPWTREDETLWNDPRLLRLEHDITQGLSSDDHSDGSDKGSDQGSDEVSVEGSAEAVSNRTTLPEEAPPLAEVLYGTTSALENEVIYEAEGSSTNQQVAIGVDREITWTLGEGFDWDVGEEHTWNPGDPFHGTVEDMLEAYPDEREESDNMLDACHFIDWEYSEFNI